eukprot:scaffold25992_cov135-Isochrysis_galbana.AAC.7
MVSSSLDPFLPTAAELAGDAPPDGAEPDQFTDRQACDLPARRALPANDHTTKHPLQKVSMSPKPLNPIQEEDAGKLPTEGHKESLGRLDQTQHYLLVFTQVTNGQPFVRIDTSKANWEGEPCPLTTLCPLVTPI